MPLHPNHRFGDPHPRRIAVFRALQLGDLLCTVPALRALRGAFPEARITLIGLPWSRSFVRRYNHILDEFIEFPGFPGLPERYPQLYKLPAFLQEIQQMKFDLALQMQGSGGVSNPLVALFGARLNAGFCLPGQYCPDEERFLSYPVHEPEVWRHLRLMEFLGIPDQGEYLEFPLQDSDWDDLRYLFDRYNLVQGRYFCIHPGARSRERRWSMEKFAQLGDFIFDLGFQVALTGTEEEAYLTQAVAGRMSAPCVDLAGCTSLGSMAALLANSRMLVCNDTGVSHLASALQVPSVVLYTASDPKLWAPLNRNLHRVIEWATAATPELVLDEVESVLREEPVYAG